MFKTKLLLMYCKYSLLELYLLGSMLRFYQYKKSHVKPDFTCWKCPLKNEQKTKLTN